LQYIIEIITLSGHFNQCFARNVSDKPHNTLFAHETEKQNTLNIINDNRI